MRSMKQDDKIYDVEVQFIDGEIGEYEEVQVSLGQIGIGIVSEERELFIPYSNIFYFSRTVNQE